MKQNTRSRNFALILAFAAFTLSAGASPAAWAGAESPLGTEVYIYPSGLRASGIIAMARKSLDSNQKIGCSLSATTTVISLRCQAQDKDGASVSCTKVSPTPLEQSAVGGLTADSFIAFESNSVGTCTYLFVSKASDLGSGRL